MEIKFDMEGGCNLVEGVGFRHIKITELEVVSFLRPGEEFISGEEMVVRAKELGANLSRRHAEYLLEHHDEIPKEFQKYAVPVQFSSLFVEYHLNTAEL